MIYKYKAISNNGQVIEGYFEAENKGDVLDMLKSNNYLPVSIEQDIEVTDAKVILFSKKVKKRDMAIFCRQFYTMINAGIGIVKCLDILEKQSENKILKKAIFQLYENVQKGFTLSEAMKKHKKIFPPLLINMIEAGEVSGSLDTIMDRMAIHFEKENKLENKIKSALVYPISLAFISISVVVFLLTVVMPTFISMFESSGAVLPGPTQAILTISNFLTRYWYLVVSIIFGLSIGLFSFKQSKEGRKILDIWKIKIPFIKKINIKIVTARFTRTLSTLLASGIPLLQSIEIVGKVSGNVVIQDRLMDSIESIRKGLTLSKAIKDIGFFPPMVDSMISIGEESGSLDEILYKTADFYDEEVEVSLQRMATLMEPTMLVLMAIIIGFIVIAMAMPMFDMVNTL